MQWQFWRLLVIPASEQRKEGGGPESRPCASENLTVLALFEACCESLPCWHLSGPQTSFTVVEWDAIICVMLPTQLCYRRDSWENLWSILAPEIMLTDHPLIKLISQLAPFIHHVLNLTTFRLSVPFPWSCPLRSNDIIRNQITPLMGLTEEYSFVPNRRIAMK